MKRIGDCTRRRRFADRARRAWYAHHRAVRFARRFGGKPLLPAGAVAGETTIARGVAGISPELHGAGRANPDCAPCF